MAMPPPETPPQDPNAQDAAPDDSQEPSGGLKGLIVNVNNGLTKLKEVFSGSQEIPPDAIKQLDMALQSFQGAIQTITQGAGQSPPAEAPGAPPAAAKPPMKGPMPMSGGPGMKPAM